ncbi:hypothetical protein [Alishewanella longhuensis]
MYFGVPTVICVSYSPSDERFRGFDEVIGHHVFELFNDEGVAIVKAAYQKRFASSSCG